MRYERVGLSLFGAIAADGGDPRDGDGLAVPHQSGDGGNAVSDGEVSPFIRDLADVLLRAFEGLLKYL